jgi:glycosidase
LDKIKPVYMLAEDNTQYSLLSEAFNSNYGWELFYNIMKSIPPGEQGSEDIKSYIDRTMKLYPKGSYPMNFITNHDTNSWEGTTSEIFGEAEKTMATLSFTLPWMPLIYSGQEVGLNLVRSLNIKAVGTNGFSDVLGDGWYADAVTAAVYLGIINGRSTGVFDPSAQVTRQEMDVMLKHTYVFKSGNKEVAVDPLNGEIGLANVEQKEVLILR